jgi:hypothetical protein
MMLLLFGDVLLHHFEIGLAHGKIRATALPFKVRVITTALLDPCVRDAFQLLHAFRLRDRASKPREDVNMIFHTADLDRRANRVVWKRRPDTRATHPAWPCRAATADGLWWKNEMNVNGGKRLWHGGRMTN